MKKSLIEVWFPVKEISRDAAIEMSYKPRAAYIKHCKELNIPRKFIKTEFFDPKIRNIHPWFARRPCSVARAMTLAAILPSELDKDIFMDAIGWKEKPKAFLEGRYPPLLFYTDPKKNLIENLVRRYIGKSAGEIIVCDPMAGGGTIPLESLRLGFRSIAVEYNPVAYLILKATIEFPALYGRTLARRVREESQKIIRFAQKELGKFYPEDAEGYIIARGVQCPRCEGIIPLLSTTQIDSSNYLKIIFDSQSKTFNISIVNHPTRFTLKSEKRTFTCPYCGFKINKTDAYKIWTAKHVKILDRLMSGGVDKEEILSTHILLVRQTKENYVTCNEEDLTLFLNSCRELSRRFSELKKYLPNSEIPESNEVFSSIKNQGIRRWYQLFNPRQLLGLLVLLSYVHEFSERALTNSELDMAVSLYLALGVSKVADYNSILTTWKKGTIRDAVGQYARGRKMSYSENYCEAILPYRNLNWIYEPNLSDRRTQGGICPVLEELCKRIGGLDKIEIIRGDSRYLSSMVRNSIDVINVDPPYFDQHIYSDISEYFWQVLRIAMEPVLGHLYFFGDKHQNGWCPKSTDVPRDGEVIVRKKHDQAHSKEWYMEQMATIFKECYKVIRSDGLLLVWFTHRSIEAWKAILTALYVSGFHVSKVWPVTSELLTRLVAKNGAAINRTLLIVARKGYRDMSDEELKKYAIEFIKGSCDALIDAGITGPELPIFLQAIAMCAVTKKRPPENLDLKKYFQTNLIKLANKILESISSDINEIFRKYENKRHVQHGLNEYL